MKGWFRRGLELPSFARAMAFVFGMGAAELLLLAVPVTLAERVIIGLLTGIAVVLVEGFDKAPPG